MYAQQLGFASSWKMLTRDKGWIKPMLVLTLVGVIPILGQIAIFGYGLEWARLTAWGVDAAPKQRGVAYGKLLSTGGIAFLIMLSMSIVLGIIDVLLFGGWYPLLWFPLGTGILSGSLSEAFVGLAGGSSVLLGIVILVVNLLMGTFTTAAMMRATIYDSFGAGWRVDRLFQMIGRDPGGFLHVYVVSLIGGVIGTAYSALVTLLGGAFLFGGAMSFVIGAGTRGSNYINHLIFDMGPGILVIGVICVIAVIFIGAVIGTVTQLISINAAGQWFCRFEVGRWGVSSAPLPDGVPRGTGKATGAPDGYPQKPVMPQEETVSQQPAPHAEERKQPADATQASAPGAAAAPKAPKDVTPDAPSQGAATADAPEPSRGPILLGPVTVEVKDGPAEDGGQEDSPIQNH